MTILDTNVFSEALTPSPSVTVLQWLKDQESATIYLTAITQAEILFGVELLPAGKRRSRLSEAVEQIFFNTFYGRILPFDEHAAQMYAKTNAARRAVGRPISQSDAMIASIARSHGATVATRNVADFENCGVRIINPWIK